MTTRSKISFGVARAWPWLLLAMIAVSGAVAVLRIVCSMRRQAAAAERIEQLGGQVGWGQSAPQWLLSIVGNDRGRLFESVTSVGLSGTGVDDDDLRWITEMPELEELYIHNNPALTDACLSYVARRVKLRRLYMESPRMTDAGIGRLTGLTELQELYMPGVPMTDAGAEYLASMARLRWLVIDSPLVTDKGAARIGRLKGLTFLMLCGTSVTDHGLEALVDLPELQTLGLSETMVTDAGLIRLAGMKTLRSVLLEHTDVTEGGVESFKESRPDVALAWSPK